MLFYFFCDKLGAVSPKAIKIIVWVVKGGIFILPLLALIISDALFFPFITGKNFFFRVAVEILLFLWILAAVFDKKYRPKFSPLLFALSAFVLILFLSTIFGENSYRSFWSNFERMEGLVGHLHLFAYFLILSSVFKKEKDFKWLFIALVAVSVIISVYAYLQFLGKVPAHQGSAKLDATLGNSTYLAIYIIFHLFIMGWLFLKTPNVWLKSLLAFLFIFELPIVYYTMTRGAVLGLFGGAVIFTLLTAIFSKQKKIRYSFALLLVFLIIITVLFVVFKDSSFVRNRPTLDKIASISLTQGTVESRLTIWGMSWEGFKERPILGWGPENFNLVFNTYFKPKLWRQEPWFDRAHNIVFDWLISAGIFGFLAYWSVFGTALYMLWRRKGATNLDVRPPSNLEAAHPRLLGGHISSMEAAVFTSLFAAYSFHNLFVFDNLTSYYLFFSILGFVHYKWTTDRPPATAEKSAVRSPLALDLSIIHYLVITATFIIVVFSLYFVNLKPYLAAKQLLVSLRDAGTGQSVDAVLNDFDKVFSYKTFGTAEAREQLSGYADNILSNPQIPQAQKEKVVAKAFQEMEAQVNVAPNDTRYRLFLGALYAKSGRTEDALNTLNKALELSPKKQQIYFVVADAYLAVGQNDKALEIIETAYNLDQTYKEAAKNLATLMIMNNRSEEGERLLEKHYGKKIIADNQLLNAYARTEDYEKVKEIWLEFIKENPDNAQYYVNLAATHLQLEEREESIKALEKAIETEPRFKEHSVQ